MMSRHEPVLPSLSAAGSSAEPTPTMTQCSMSAADDINREPARARRPRLAPAAGRRARARARARPHAHAHACGWGGVRCVVWYMYSRAVEQANKHFPNAFRVCPSTWKTLVKQRPNPFKKKTSKLLQDALQKHFKACKNVNRTLTQVRFL